jgi:hypothetical protein
MQAQNTGAAIFGMFEMNLDIDFKRKIRIIINEIKPAIGGKLWK